MDIEEGFLLTGKGGVLWLHKLGIDDVEEVGGKNASLGEMIQHLAAAGVQVPGSFVTTAFAYREFLAQNALDQRIHAELAQTRH